MRGVGLVARVPAEPSRHRVAVWRELRRLGAVAIGQSVWVLPDHPVATSGLGRIAELVARGGGELTLLDAAGRDQASRDRLERVYVQARADEWTEFRAECARYLAELDKEIGKGKLTVADWKKKSRAWNGCAAGIGSCAPATCSPPPPPTPPTGTSGRARPSWRTTPPACSTPSTKAEKPGAGPALPPPLRGSQARIRLPPEAARPKVRQDRGRVVEPIARSAPPGAARALVAR